MPLTFIDKLNRIPLRYNDLSKQTEVLRDINMLLQSGVTSKEALRSMIRTGKGQERLIAIWVSGLIGRWRISSTLVLILQNRGESDEVRQYAANALTMLPSKTSVPALMHTLENIDNDIRGRELAAYTIGHIGDGRAITPLIAALTNREEAEVVRAQAAESLGYMEARQSSDALCICLSDTSAPIRFWCCYALGNVSSRRAIPALQHIAQTDTTFVPGWGTVGQEAQGAINRIVAKQK